MSAEPPDTSRGARLWDELRSFVSRDPDLARYMQLSFDEFHRRGEWPSIEQLQKRLLRAGDHIDLYAVAARIPGELGTDPVRVQSKCYLAVAGVAVCDGSEDECRDFLRVLRLAVDKYLADEDGADVQPSIASAELSGVGITGVALKRLYEMTDWAPFLGGGSSAPDGSWERYVQPATRHFIKVRTIEEYVNAFGAMITSPYRRSIFQTLRAAEDISATSDEGEPPQPSVAEPTRAVPETEAVGPDRRQVFVVHGRNEPAREAMFNFLRAIGLSPIEWSKARALTQEPSPYIGTILDAAFKAAQAVVVLLTPDEVSYLRPEFADENDPETQPAAQARPNVLFEAGMAMGHSSGRTVLVELGAVRPFSDVVGRHAVRLDNEAGTRKDLAERLKTAGCDIDLAGTDWLKAGDFTPPPQPGGGLPLGRRILQQHARRVSIDLRYHNRGNGEGRLEILNRGTETVYDLDLEFPPEAGNFGVVGQNELPLVKLPAGKSVMLIAIQTMGGGGRSHFDVRVTGQTDDGMPVSEDVFLSIR